MNFNPSPAKKRIGLCAACGKSTRLLIHQQCGEKLIQKGLSGKLEKRTTPKSSLCKPNLMFR